MEYKKYKTIGILDIETTDKYWNSCGPIQIAAVICDNKGNIIDSFNERIKTTHKINPEASAVHGIYEKDLVNCRKESEVLLDFCVWLEDNKVDVILTYNGEAFDRRVLQHRCEVLHIDYDFFNKEKFPGVDGYYDCVMIAKKKNLYNLNELGRKWKLTLVAEKLGFSTENAHDALADVLMLKNIWFIVDPQIHPADWGEPQDLF